MSRWRRSPLGGSARHWSDRRGRPNRAGAMQNSSSFIIVSLVCGVATVIAAVQAGRSRQARHLGHAAMGVLLIGPLATFGATVGVLTISRWVTAPIAPL